MICSKCGFNCSDSARFCRECGAELNAAPAIQPAAVQPQPQTLQPQPAPAVMSEKAQKRERRGIPRIILLLLMLILIFAINIFMFGFMQSSVVDVADTTRYDFKEFSISMSPDMKLYCAVPIAVSGYDKDGNSNNILDTEINGEEFSWVYNYYMYSSKDACFFAYTSFKRDDDCYIDIVEDNPGELAYKLGKGLLAYGDDYDVSGYKRSGGIVRFTVRNGKYHYYFYARELVRNNRIVVCGLYSVTDNDKMYTSWLLSAKVNDYS